MFVEGEGRGRCVWEEEGNGRSVWKGDVCVWRGRGSGMIGRCVGWRGLLCVCEGEGEVRAALRRGDKIGI